MGSDVHFVVGRPPMIRINGSLVDTGEFEVLSSKDIENYAKELLTEKQYLQFKEKYEYDFAFSIEGQGRYRANVHIQRGTVGIAIRLLNRDNCLIY